MLFSPAWVCPCVCVKLFKQLTGFVVFAKGQLKLQQTYELTESTPQRKLMSADWFNWILQGFVMPCSVSLRIDLFGNVDVFPASVSVWCKSNETRLQGFAELARILCLTLDMVTRESYTQPDTQCTQSPRLQQQWRTVLWDEGDGCSPSQRHYRKSSCEGLAPCPRTLRLDRPDKITDLNIQYTVHLHLSLENSKVEALLYQWMVNWAKEVHFSIPLKRVIVMETVYLSYMQTECNGFDT